MNFHDLSALRILAVMEKSCSTNAESVFHEGSLVYMGVSENSVPLHPMVNDHYPY